MNKLSGNSSTRLIIVLVIFSLVKILCGLLFGLGWFFLLQTLQRLIIAIPRLFIPVLRIIVGEERAEEEKRNSQLPTARIIYSWRLIVALIWLGLTIFVFLEANITIFSVIDKINQ